MEMVVQFASAQNTEITNNNMIEVVRQSSIRLNSFTYIYIVEQFL